MKPMSLIAALILTTPVARAARITDLDVMDVSFEDTATFQFKVRSRANRIEEFFFLSFEKASKQNMNQLSYVLMKLTRGDRVKIDADIPSFSAHPAGALYNVSDVRFTVRGQRDPNQVVKEPARK